MSLKAAEGNDAKLENLWEMEVGHPIDEHIELLPVRRGVALGRTRSGVPYHFDHNILTQGPAELELSAMRNEIRNEEDDAK